MLQGKIISVIIPAYNEENNIGRVIETIPDFVDRIIIVNDGSTDQTLDRIRSFLHSIHDRSNLSIPHPGNISGYNIESSMSENSRILIIHHSGNYGKGAGIRTGYQLCKMLPVNCIATMDGDGQMDPNDLRAICEPVVNDTADYTKGDRLSYKDVRKIMPSIRYLENLALTLLTKISSGYWNITDAQTGYTCISHQKLCEINIDHLYPYYGYPNEMLALLNVQSARLREVQVRPIYESHHQSKMTIIKVIPRITFLLARSYVKRIWEKYFRKKVHPVSILLISSILLFPFTPSIAIVLFIIATYWDIRIGNKLVI